MFCLDEEFYLKVIISEFLLFVSLVWVRKIVLLKFFKIKMFELGIFKCPNPEFNF